MISGLIGTVFKIIELIWKAPVWLVVLIIVLLVVWNFFAYLFDGSNDSGGSDVGYGGSADCPYTDEIWPIGSDKVEKSFVFYDSNGDRRGRGDCFYDSRGYRRNWGDGFYDGKGYYRSWGDSYYDACGYFRSWGERFYDTEGNLVYPE